MTTLTIKELKTILDQYDESIQVVIYRDGNGNCYPVTEDRISIHDDGAYFVDSGVENTTSEKVLCFEMY